MIKYFVSESLLILKLFHDCRMFSGFTKVSDLIFAWDFANDWLTITLYFWKLNVLKRYFSYQTTWQKLNLRIGPNMPAQLHKISKMLIYIFITDTLTNHHVLCCLLVRNNEISVLCYMSNEKWIVNHFLIPFIVLQYLIIPKWSQLELGKLNWCAFQWE